MTEAFVEAWTIDEDVSLAATAHLPEDARRVGVVFIVGGNQTRAGAHRQFVRLARQFAVAGYPCLRFDLPGLGDSEGELRAFDDNGMFLQAAIDTLMRNVPEVDRVVLWGLCDGATAAALYAAKDSRVVGLLLANPWVRNAQLRAQVLVRSYYRQRLMSGAFWAKLLSGRVGVMSSVGEWFANWREARKVSDIPASPNLPARVLQALNAFSGALEIIIAEHDLTAQEFQQANTQSKRLPVRVLLEADHTFSQSVHHVQLAALSLDLLARCERRP